MSLSPGQYTVSITPYDDNGSEIQTPEDPAPHSFTVLEPEVDEAIKTELTAVREVQLPGGAPAEAQVYSLALAYARHGLYADAIQQLSTLLPTDIIAGQGLPDPLLGADTFAGSPELYLRLGDYYRTIHLPFEAWLAYEVGLQIAEACGDEASTAWAHAGLAEVMVGTTQIIEHYEAAIAFFCGRVEDEVLCEALREALEAYQ